MSTIVVRPATEAELTLVRDSWARSFLPRPPKHGEDGGDPFVQVTRGGGLSPRAWFTAHRALAEAYLSTSTVLIAAHAARPDTALGWICFDGSTLHYVFTLQIARRKGIAARLLDEVAAGFRCTHTTRDGKALLDAYRRKARRAA